MKGDFTSAATFPVKLLHNPVIQHGKVVPYHITMIPTNVCNKDCAECFCYERDKEKELPLSEIEKIVDESYNLGTRAISLSGGGEPDCHPDINQIISYIHNEGIDVALVTNGKNLHRIQDRELSLLDWIRVSGTSSSPTDFRKLKLDIERAPDTGWALSYILSEFEPSDYNNLKQAVEFSNHPPTFFDDKWAFFTGNHNYGSISHLRVVSDMKYPNENRLPIARENIRKSLDDSKVVWQERTTNKRGSKECLVPLVHPIVDANGDMQPCCGAHFATKSPAYKYEKETAICNWKDYHKYVEEQTIYDGTKCDICQYSQYNDVLKMLLDKPKNRKFV